MLKLNGNVYTIEHGPCDEETDIYVDLIRENGQPYARILNDGQLGQVTLIRDGKNLSLHEKLDCIRQYDIDECGAEYAYFRAVADALPYKSLAEHARELIRQTRKVAA